MRALQRIGLLTLGVVLSAGCAASTKREVKNVAANDLGCDQVQVSEISGDRYGAFGCGRGAVYMKVCEGSNCHWGRLRHGHEAAVGGQQPWQNGGGAPERSVIPAPPPQPRQVIPAPPPGQAPSSGGETPAPAAGSATGSAPAGGSTSSDSQAPVPLSEGQLSDPYQTNVPAQQTVQRSEQPPPQPLPEDQPPAPAPNYVWVPGYWWWSSASWLWLPGYWCPPMVGFSYVPGGWYWSSGYWWYGPGGWAYPGSSVIVYHVAPRPSTTATVRAFTPARVVANAAGHGAVPPAHVGPGGAVNPGGPIVHAPAANAFHPSPSPLYRYPTPSTPIARGPGVALNRPGGVGRVVRPGESVRPPVFSGSPRSVYRPSSSAPYRVSPSWGAPSHAWGAPSTSWRAPSRSWSMPTPQYTPRYTPAPRPSYRVAPAPHFAPPMRAPSMPHGGRR